MILDEIATCGMSEYYIGEKEYREIVDPNCFSGYFCNIEKDWTPWHALPKKQQNISGACGKWKNVLIIRRPY